VRSCLNTDFSDETDGRQKMFVQRSTPLLLASLEEIKFVSFVSFVFEIYNLVVSGFIFLSLVIGFGRSCV
jgi:hypothetical protein